MYKTSISYLILLQVIALLMFAGCMNPEQGQAPLPEHYLESLREWKDYRVNVLKGPTNWLRLDGIYWLDEGENSFGSGDDQDLVFPEGTIPAHAGIMILANGIVTMIVADGITILHNGEPVSEMVIFDGENRERIQHEQLEWFIDSRGNNHGVRLYNKDNPKADAFEGFPSYPVKPEWHLKANFTANSDSILFTLDNVIGEEVERFSPGNVWFNVDGKRYTLITFEANSGLFILFADRTNQMDTYHSGRYMIIPFPDENGNTIIDFNKAYNPPCAFNRFTTCQLPPPQNRLDIAIPAGEKRPVDWDGI